MTAPARSPRD